MRESSKRRDYHVYEWSYREFAWTVLQSVGVVLLFSLFFYRSIWAVLPLMPVGVLFFRQRTAHKRDVYQENMIEQFRECMLSVATSMKAGYAVENAFMESAGDMCLLYGEDSAIYQELELIRRGLVINITLEELLLDLAVRSDSEEIKEFAEMFAIAKRNSGNLAEIMESSARLIGRRLDTKSEIRTLLGGKQLELTVMRGMPFAIMAYIGVTYPGYFDPLYYNWQGVLLMSGCLVLYLVAYLLGEYILRKIEEEVL